MPGPTSPISRALKTLELLQRQPGITADQLGGRLGVTERAARRYVAMLRDADIPVESVRGPYGGYRLGRGVRLPPLVFSADEALGLVMAVLDGSHPARDDADPVGAALGKILRALPAGVGDQAAMVRDHTATTDRRQDVRPRPGIASALVSAAAAHHRARIEYRSAGGGSWTETVDPWAVVVRFGLWYLLCHSHRVDDVRTYRVDRIEAVHRLDETFAPPPAGFDPAGLLDRHLATGWEHPTRVVFDAPRAVVAPYLPAAMGQLEPLTDQRCVLTGTTSNPQMYAGEWLAAIPLPYRVEGGSELREAVAAVARRLTSALAPDS